MTDYKQLVPSVMCEVLLGQKGSVHRLRRTNVLFFGVLRLHFSKHSQERMSLCSELVDCMKTPEFCHWKDFFFTEEFYFKDFLCHAEIVILLKPLFMNKVWTHPEINDLNMCSPSTSCRLCYFKRLVF